MPDLVLPFLLVSCLGFVSHVLAFIRLMTQVGAVSDPGFRDRLRTVGCRVLVSTIYVTVAAIAFAGAGTLTAEALIVFTVSQTVWTVNSLLDARNHSQGGRCARCRMSSGG